MTEEAYQPPAPPPTTIQNVVLANLAVPIALLALPVFLATGHEFNSWAIASGLWLVNRLIQQGVNRFIIGLPQTVAMGVAGVTFISRAWGVLIALVLAVHFAGRAVALPAAILFARALHLRHGRARGLLRQQPSPACGDAPLMLARRLPLFVLPLAVALAAPSLALAKEPKVDPTKEFLLHDYIRIKPFSWLDLSITKAVIYLIAAGVVAAIAPILIIRGGLRQKPRVAQAVVEIVYDFAETSIGRASLPEKVFRTWFPYIASLFVFIWVSNLISYIPLPFDTEHKWHGIPGFTLYAATANISVTLALTLVTFFASHFVGIKYQGFVPYFKHWVPPGAEGRAAVRSRCSRCSRSSCASISLSVRLFANMLAGHLLVLMSAALVIIIGHWYIGVHHDARRHLLLPVRAAAGRQSAGVHLRDALRHLHRLRGRATPLITTASLLKEFVDHGC